MLNTLTPTQVHAIAELAGAARDAREQMLHGIAAELVNAPHPAKGEADRAGAGLFDVLASDAPTTRVLSAAIDQLGVDERAELFVLMRVGQGELAPRDWARGLADAEVLGETNTRGILIDDIDLQSHLEKGLHEVRPT